jgi:hypothetical protein
MKARNRCIIFCVVLLWLSAVSSVSPGPPQELTRGIQLEPGPYNPAVDPDYDKFISSWKNSTPKTLYGALREHAMLTRNPGDPLRPRT